ADFDCDEAPADRVAHDLRADAALERRQFQVVALASAVTAETKRASIRAGIGESIVKPMSPKYLLERVLSRLERRAVPPARPPRRPLPAGGNVIPLFSRPPAAVH